MLHHCLKRYTKHWKHATLPLKWTVSKTKLFFPTLRSCISTVWPQIHILLYHSFSVQTLNWIDKQTRGGFMSYWTICTYLNVYLFHDNYRLITTYFLLRVNLDKIMHARWDFDASSARTRRVSALDKHQNWSASALFCLNSRAQSKYAVVNLIHAWRKQIFLSFTMW